MLKDVSMDEWIVYTAKNKLDTQSRMLYEQHIENIAVTENSNTFFTFLHKRCRVLEAIAANENEYNEIDHDADESTCLEAGEYVHD